jgi:hypothetical protein
MPVLANLQAYSSHVFATCDCRFGTAGMSKCGWAALLRGAAQPQRVVPLSSTCWSLRSHLRHAHNSLLYLQASKLHMDSSSSGTPHPS